MYNQQRLFHLAEEPIFQKVLHLIGLAVTKEKSILLFVLPIAMCYRIASLKELFLEMNQKY